MDFMNPDRWIDYQRAFDVRYDFGRSVGLADALELCEIEPDGHFHDGLDDAINTAKIIKKLEEDPEYQTVHSDHVSNRAGIYFISYVQLEDKYDSGIFTAQKRTAINKAFRAEKHIQPYVFTDGNAAKSVERQFAEALDGAAEVCAYAKLPKTYVIPTPVGNYSPDWAIAFKEGTVKHVFVVAETKGTMESLQLRPIEQAKIMCARKLFNEISTDNVVYHDVDSYQSLLNILYLQ